MCRGRTKRASPDLSRRLLNIHAQGRRDRAAFTLPGHSRPSSLQMRGWRTASAPQDHRPAPSVPIPSPTRWRSHADMASAAPASEPSGIWTGTEPPEADQQGRCSARSVRSSCLRISSSRRTRPCRRWSRRPAGRTRASGTGPGHLSPLSWVTRSRPCQARVRL